MGAVIDCFVAVEKNLLFGDNGIELPRFGFQDAKLRLNKVFNLSIRLWMKLGQSCSGISGQSDALRECFKHTQQMTAVRMELIGDATPVSSTAAISARFTLHIRRGNVMLGVLMFSWCLTNDLIDEYAIGDGCSYTKLDSTLGELLLTVLSETWRSMPSSALEQSRG